MWPIDRAVDKHDQVEVADPADVVTGGQRSRDKQVCNPSRGAAGSASDAQYVVIGRRYP